MSHPEFDAFVETIAILRAPGGCPWDREQTHRSIASNMIEEAAEAVDAIEAEDIAHMREELGDVLLQVVLQSQIAADAGEFTIDDVCRDVNDKIIRRHPHVFGDAVAGTPEEVLRVWDKEKLAEREASDASAASGSVSGAQVPGLLDSTPRSLPALMQAQKISRKAAACGFEWESLDDVWAKVYEEEDELKSAYAVFERVSNEQASKVSETPEISERAPAGSASSDDPSGESQKPSCPDPRDEAKENVMLEMGDVLFSLVNVARKMGVSAEEALRATCGKFRERWRYMEDSAADAGMRVEDLGSDQLESLWESAKDAGL